MKGGNYHSSDSYVDYDTYNQYLPQQVIDSIQYQQQKSRNYQYQNSRNSQYSLQRFPSYDNFITDENTYYNGSTYYQDTTSYHYNRGGISPNMTYIGSSNRTRKISRVDSHESFASPQNGNDKFRLLPCRTFICTGSCPYGEKCVFLHDPRVTSTTTWIRGKFRKPKEEATIDAFFWTPMAYEDVSDKLDDRRQPHVSQEFVVKRPDKASFGKNSSGKYTAREFKTAMAVYSMWSHFLEFNVKLQEKTEQEEEAKRQLQVIQNSFFSYTFPQWSGQQLWSEEQQQLINSTSTGNNLNLKESSTKLIRSSSISANRPPTPRSVLQADWSPFSDESWEESPDPSDEINKHTGRRRLSVFVALSQGFSM